MKFLVLWKLELSLLSPHVAAAVARMPAYARRDARPRSLGTFGLCSPERIGSLWDVPR